MTGILYLRVRLCCLLLLVLTRVGGSRGAAWCRWGPLAAASEVSGALYPLGVYRSPLECIFHVYIGSLVTFQLDFHPGVFQRAALCV